MHFVLRLSLGPTQLAPSRTQTLTPSGLAPAGLAQTLTSEPNRIDIWRKVERNQSNTGPHSSLDPGPATTSPEAELGLGPCYRTTLSARLPGYLRTKRYLQSLQLDPRWPLPPNSIAPEESGYWVRNITCT